MIYSNLSYSERRTGYGWQRSRGHASELSLINNTKDVTKQRQAEDVRENTSGRANAQVALVVRNLPANAGDVRDLDSIPRSGRGPGGGHGNPLQYSCLENPMDRGAWRAIIHRVVHN